LKNIKPEMWCEIYAKMKEERKKIFESNIYFTTSDAHTLTDGPTIFLTSDVEKISQCAIQNSKIPTQVIDDLMHDIEHNNMLSDKIDVLDKEIQNIEEEKEKMRSGDDNKSKSGGAGGVVVDTREIREKQQMIDIIRSIRESAKDPNFKTLDMRIGIHTGKIVGGIIGSKVVRYDIFGNNVLIANKMESNGVDS
jgi:hypothetical protein